MYNKFQASLQEEQLVTVCQALQCPIPARCSKCAKLYNARSLPAVQSVPSSTMPNPCQPGWPTRSMGNMPSTADWRCLCNKSFISASYQWDDDITLAALLLLAKLAFFLQYLSAATYIKSKQAFLHCSAANIQAARDSCQHIMAAHCLVAVLGKVVAKTLKISTK